MKRVAAIQMASGANVSVNLIEAERHISLAAANGAKLIVLPENFALMGLKEEDKVGEREPDGHGRVQEFLSNQAIKNDVWIVGGTIALESNDPQKVASACLVYDGQGKRVARYDKIHLFDVSLGEAEERYTESQTIVPGDDVVVIDSPFGRLGLAVCYDLRFPEMFRRMHEEGVSIVAIPSAFTAITGKAHWEILVRARAIENLCYVVAAGQGGYHLNGRETYGDSMIVNPWGGILDRLTRGAGVVSAQIDEKKLMTTRKNFPALDHRKI